MTVSRRTFLAALARGAGAVAAAGTLATGGGARRLGAQPAPARNAPDAPATPTADSAANPRATPGQMNADVYRPVRRLPRPGAGPSMTAAARDDIEHHIRCQCGCPLDLYTCRTTDFSCGVSPRMHGDVLRLVEGGYSADEILATLRGVYGEQVLMAPVKEGFNWAGYVMPVATLGTGAVVVLTLIRRWAHRVQAPGSSAATLAAFDIAATPAELARLEAAVRGDEPWRRVDGV